GDGIVGVEPQGVERVADPGRAAAPCPTRGGKTNVVADGVRDLPRGVHPDAVPDRTDGSSIDLPVAVVEPVARSLPPAGRAAARLLAMLNGVTLKSGSVCPDPSGPSNEEWGLAM